MRTYLYVDGENFAMRAAGLAKILDADPALRARLLERFGTRGLGAVRDFGTPPRWEWTPEPHTGTDALVDGTAGILHSTDEVYWDPTGLALACIVNLAGLDHLVSHQRLELARAFYVTSAAGNRIEPLKSKLHELGFLPHVLQRVKRDPWAEDLAKLGITLVSKPKGADIFLTTQVLEDAWANNFDRCVVVTGDADFVPLFDAVRRRGKTIWLAGFEHWLPPSSPLRQAADRFLAYDPVLAARPWPKGWNP